MFFESRKQSRKRRYSQMMLEDEIAASQAVLVGLLLNQKPRKQRSPNEQRNNNWWEEGYQTWHEKAFKDRFRINRETFDFILREIEDSLIKEPTNCNPEPMSPAMQLAVCLYRLAHGCSFATVADLFAISKPTACVTFNKVCRVIVRTLYDRVVIMPQSRTEWKEELRGFLENWEFPCVGAWDGFHVYVSTHIKNYFSFKKRYSVTNMGLIGHNKRFLWAAVGAPGSTHDSRLLKSCAIYDKIEEGTVMPNRMMRLPDCGTIPFTTVGDSAFPRRNWLLKPYNENTCREAKKKYFNKRLCSARVVSEHAYGMLKGRWRFLYKKTECKLSNIQHVIMAGITLHNICITRYDPCRPRWRLKVNQLHLIRRGARGGAEFPDPEEVRGRIANWLWAIKEDREGSQ